MELRRGLDQACSIAALPGAEMVIEKKSAATRGRAEPQSAPATRVRAKSSFPKRKRNVTTAKGDGADSVSSTERALMIARSAYHRAERRGFAPGHELEDWLAAEREITRLLGPPPPPRGENRD